MGCERLREGNAHEGIGILFPFPTQHIYCRRGGRGMIDWSLLGRGRGHQTTQAA